MEKSRQALTVSVWAEREKRSRRRLEEDDSIRIAVFFDTRR